MNMFLTNKTRLKIKDIVKRISLDEPVALEERIYVEKLILNSFYISYINHIK